MNLNYVNSVAERFMKFRSSLSTSEDVHNNLFDCLTIYVPKSLAASQFAAGKYDPDAVTADKYAVITITVDNYNDVFATGSSLLSQWLPIFNDGTNSALIMYVIVFDDTGFNPTLSAQGIEWAPLTKAFKEMYFISFFKTMFSEHYDGSEVVHEPAEEGDYSDKNYFDMALCLAALCETEATLSFDLVEAKVRVFAEGETDTNACKVMSLSRGDETTHCATLIGTNTEDRATYFWGYLNLVASSHSSFLIHNGVFVTPIQLGKYFEKKNGSNQFIGNKLCKIRLTNSKIKPTGLPSELNSDVNLNLGSYIYDNLDAKNVGYLLSIADNSDANAEILRACAMNKMPTTAYSMAKWIDYNASQDMAKYATDASTLTNPVLTNEKTYSELQSFLKNRVNAFASTGRLTGINIQFPPYNIAKQGNWFKGTAVWSAVYVDDFEGVDVSGSISF